MPGVFDPSWTTPSVAHGGMHRRSNAAGLSPRAAGLRLSVESALLPDGWAEEVALDIDPAGEIVAVHSDAPATGSTRVEGVVVPGMPNVHSHAFQRAMAGLAESASAGPDFWSWRDVMYRFANRVTDDDILAIAGQLFVEMLKSGYTTVGEFQYIHHQPDGARFDPPARMTVAILEAARHTGIGVTLLPTLYVRRGFDAESTTEAQRRFVNSLESWLAIVEETGRACADDANARVGLAFHSLRAVPPDVLREAMVAADAIDPAAPRHIHAAEQAEEVRACQAATGQRPIAWLLEKLPVDERWCVVHATHMDDDELAALARCGAVTGLCPTTEANLGDGVFALEPYLALGGAIGVGSDSNVSVSPVAELRCLEYGQRLTHQRRLIHARAGDGHVGARLWKAAVSGGARALGRPIGRIAPRHRADLVVLDPAHPSLTGRSRDSLLDSWIFASQETPVRDVMVGGRWVVRDGRHAQQEAIAEAYRLAMARIC